jgi:cytochrome c heme-lyase
MYPQVPQIDQVFPLNISRQVSSIPRGSSRDHGDATERETDAGLAKQSRAAAISNGNLPHHQAGTTDDDRNRWVYPSEQQLYNAMRKKGWANVPEASIPVVLQIHNAVNEKTWSRVLEYHRFCPREPRLVRFQGRPNDATPKAWFVANVLGYPPPFDRHDWYVEYYKPSPFPGGAGRWIEQRYVIDFYESGRREQSPAGAAASSPARVDARPALDSPRAAWLRAKHALQMALPGITHYWYKRGGGGGANGIEQERR